MRDAGTADVVQKLLQRFEIMRLGPLGDDRVKLVGMIAAFEIAPEARIVGEIVASHRRCETAKHGIADRGDVDEGVVAGGIEVVRNAVRKP